MNQNRASYELPFTPHIGCNYHSASDFQQLLDDSDVLPAMNDGASVSSTRGLSFMVVTNYARGYPGAANFGRRNAYCAIVSPACSSAWSCRLQHGRKMRSPLRCFFSTMKA